MSCALRNQSTYIVITPIQKHLFSIKELLKMGTTLQLLKRVILSTIGMIIKLRKLV